VVTHPEARTKGEDPMATEKSSAPHAHPSTAQVESSSRPGLFHDITLGPAKLESCSCEATITLCRHIRIARIRAAKGSATPHVCNDGWVSMEVETDEGIVEEALYLCRRCAGVDH
jgi:hypothetical protein